MDKPTLKMEVGFYNYLATIAISGLIVCFIFIRLFGVFLAVDANSPNNTQAEDVTELLAILFFGDEKISEKSLEIKELLVLLQSFLLMPIYTIFMNREIKTWRARWFFGSQREVVL